MIAPPKRSPQLALCPLVIATQLLSEGTSESCQCSGPKGSFLLKCNERVRGSLAASRAKSARSPSDHLRMTEDPAFSDNVLYLLLEDPRR